MSASDRVASPGLHRGLRRFDVIALTVNSIVGAGVFALPAKEPVEDAHGGTCRLPVTQGRDWIGSRCPPGRYE